MKRHKTYYSRGQQLTKLALRTKTQENNNEESPQMTTPLPSTSNEIGMGLDENEPSINQENFLLPDLSLADMSVGSTSFTCLDAFDDTMIIPTTLDTTLECETSSFTTETEPMIENIHLVTDNTENTNQENGLEQSAVVSEVQYTKKGTIRKRKKHELNLEARKKIKRDTIAETHSVKPTCNLESCKKKCTSKITEDRRRVINKAYWGMKTEIERKMFILNNVSCVPIKQRKVIAEDDEFLRKQNYEYTLKDENDKSQLVCKTFFMSTLGYFTSSDKFMRIVKEKADNVVPPVDKRSIREPHNKFDDQLIRDHILQFEPCVSHHRREHAPYRLYLPSDLSFTSLYNDFIQKNPNIKCSYEKYRVYAREVMKLSIVKLGHEECETCEEFRLHKKTHTDDDFDPACEQCCSWEKHNDKAKQSRMAYKIDAEKEWEERVAVYSVDLQKVIMLPRIDMFKSAIFVQRLTAYNESFVPVGKNKIMRQNQVMAVLWHEAVSGRNKEDLISTFYTFLTSHREDNKIILWLDNCTSQNKNWALYSFFIYIINSNEINADEITLKYFEPGHSFMSADSFHHRVEMSMKRAGGKIYDFQDFCQAVQQASKHVDVKSLNFDDFYDWKDYSSQHKLRKINPRPYLHDMVEVTFKKGSLEMQYKKSYDGEEISVNFIMATYKKNYQLPGPQKHNKPKGICKEKKKNLIKVLEPIILKNRLKFWKDIPVSD